MYFWKAKVTISFGIEQYKARYTGHVRMEYWRRCIAIRRTGYIQRLENKGC